MQIKLVVVVVVVVVKVSLFSSFLIKWVGWYKMWELIIYLNAINFLDELKIKRSYCFMFT